MARKITAIHTSAVMLNQRAVEFGVPPSESANRTIPVTGIRMRNHLQNATYSESGLPKIIMSFSFLSSCSLGFLKEFLSQLARTVDRVAISKVFELEKLTQFNLALHSLALRIGAAPGPIDRFLFGLHLNYPITADQFLGFRKWTVDHYALISGEPDPRALRAGLESGSVDEHARLGELFVVCGHRVYELFAGHHAGFRVFTGLHYHHESHCCVSRCFDFGAGLNSLSCWYIERTRIGSTVGANFSSRKGDRQFQGSAGSQWCPNAQPGSSRRRRWLHRHSQR